MPSLPRWLVTSDASHVLVATTAAFAWDRQRTSDVAGTASFVVWLFAQSPQICENYRRRSVSGLSLVFLAQWMAGDVTNLVGCLLTHQLPFQIAVATYFCFVDCIILAQWITYSRNDPTDDVPRMEARTRNYRRPMSQSLTLTRPMYWTQYPPATSYSAMSQTMSLNQWREAQERRRRSVPRRAQSYARHPSDLFDPVKGKQRALNWDSDRARGAQKVDMSASADLGAIARYHARVGNDHDHEMGLSTPANTPGRNHSRSTSGESVPQVRRSPSTSTSRSRSSSPARGRSKVSAAALHKLHGRAQGDSSASEQPQQLAVPPRPTVSRSRSSIRQLTQEALRVAALAERLDRRSRSRATNRGLGLPDISLKEQQQDAESVLHSQTVRSKSRKKSAGLHADRSLGKMKLREDALKEESPVDSDITIREAQGLAASGHRTPRPARSGSATPRHHHHGGPERQPLLSGSRHSSFTGDVHRGRPRRPGRAKAKATAAGIFSVLGLGGLLGMGQLGDGVGLWRSPEGIQGMYGQLSTEGVHAHREAPIRHPAMLFEAMDPMPARRDTSITVNMPQSQPDVLDAQSHRKSHERHRHEPNDRAPLPPPGGGPVDVPPPSAPPSWERLIGRFSSWVCTILYMTSRLPQIWTNYLRRSVEGLSILLFLSAFCGNALYTLSVLSNPKAVGPDREDYLRESTPFLLGSGGTLVFDAVVMFQWWSWSHVRQHRPSSRDRDGDTREEVRQGHAAVMQEGMGLEGGKDPRSPQAESAAHAAARSSMSDRSASLASSVSSLRSADPRTDGGSRA